LESEQARNTTNKRRMKVMIRKGFMETAHFSKVILTQHWFMYVPWRHYVMWS